MTKMTKISVILIKSVRIIIIVVSNNNNNFLILTPNIFVIFVIL